MKQLNLERLIQLNNDAAVRDLVVKLRNYVGETVRVFALYVESKDNVVPRRYQGNLQVVLENQIRVAGQEIFLKVNFGDGGVVVRADSNCFGPQDKGTQIYFDSIGWKLYGEMTDALAGEAAKEASQMKRRQLLGPFA